ncbi:YfhO family protein [Peijinzhouia sedimentorum]
MGKIDFKKQILPHLIAVLIFSILCVFFYSPIVFENKTIFQNDALQGIAAGTEIADYRAETGEEGLWINSMFSGMPAYLINTRHYGEWFISGIRDVLTLNLPTPANFTFLAMLSFYFLLVVFRVRPYLAIVGAIAYGFGSFSLISIEAGHNWKVGAMATMPLVLGAVHSTFYRNRYWGFIATIIAVGIQIRMNHLQVTYYLFLLLLIYGGFQLFYMIKDNQLKKQIPAIGLLVIAAILAVTMSLGRLWTTSEYSSYSIRGQSELTAQDPAVQGGTGLDKEYAFNWSWGKMETLTLILPNFYGGGSIESLDESSEIYKSFIQNRVAPQQIQEELQGARTYWGDQPSTAGPVYAGAIICFLFILGLFALPARQKNWIIAGTILSILLAWGKNLEFFNYAMFDFFPGYNKFRAVSMAVVVALMTIPFLGILGLEKLLSTESNNLKMAIFKKASVTTLGILGILFLLYLILDFRAPIDEQLMANGYPDWYVDALQKDRASMYLSDWVRSLIFIGLSIAIIYVAMIGKLKQSYLFTGLILFVSADLLVVGSRYLNEENYSTNTQFQFFQETEANNLISQDKGHFRVINLQNPWNDARVSYHHPSVGGYHGAKLRRYQDLIDYYMGDEHIEIVDSLQNQGIGLPITPVLDMLNTKYLIAGSSARAVLTNSNAYGNAWLVENMYAAENADEELAALGQLDLRNQAISSQLDSDKSYSANGTINLQEIKPNYVKYESDLASGGLAIFSEIYYPKGWTAYIDGVETPHFRANYVLRAMELPSGQHSIEFKFHPQSYYTGNQVANISNFLVIALIIVGIMMELKKAKKQEA